MYQGQIVEQGPVKSIFHTPKHDYTKALIGSRPSLDVRLKTLPTMKTWIRYMNKHTKLFRLGGLLMKVNYPETIIELLKH